MVSVVFLLLVLALTGLDSCEGVPPAASLHHSEPDTTGQCSPSQINYKCNDGQCIPELWRCDLEPDCRDGSDEMNCTVADFQCNAYQFRCDAGQCILLPWRCDGATDCPDGSDEINCSLPCAADQFRCPSGKCIYNQWKCDQERDCEDGTDEEPGMCGQINITVTRAPPVKNVHRSSPVASTIPGLSVVINDRDGVSTVRKFDHKTQSTLIHALFSWKIYNFRFFLHRPEVLRMGPITSASLNLDGVDGDWSILVQTRNMKSLATPIDMKASTTSESVVADKPAIGLALQRHNGTTGIVTAHMHSVRFMNDSVVLYTEKDVFHHTYDADASKGHADEVFAKEIFHSHDHFTGAAHIPQYLADDGSLSLKLDVYFFLGPKNSAV